MAQYGAACFLDPKDGPLTGFVRFYWIYARHIWSAGLGADSSKRGYSPP